MFGKVMSISDELMWRYFELLSFRPLEEIASLQGAIAEGRNPRDVKFELAREIVARFHEPAFAERAQQAFIARFREGETPADLPEVSVESRDGVLGLAHVLKQAGLAGSTSEAFRLICQGAVRIDGERVEDRNREIEAGSRHVLQVGKRRFARIHLI
jgi:tyrosyl-tRNA synthetase